MAPNAKEIEDPRRKVGGIVYALANKVIHPSSCARKFGSLAEKKEFRGVVQEIITEKMRRPNEYQHMYWRNTIQLPTLTERSLRR